MTGNAFNFKIILFKMLKSAVVFFFVLCFSLFYGQSKTSYDRYYNEFLKVQFSNPAFSKKYLDSILLVPRLADSLASKTYNNTGIYYAIVGDYPNAMLNFKKALYFDKNISKTGQANILCNIANLQKMHGKFDFALQNLGKAKQFYESVKDNRNLLKVESEISAVYYGQSNFSKALEISSNLIPELEAFGDKKLLNIQLLRMANIQFNIGDFKNAIKNYNRTLPYFSVDKENNLQNKYIVLMNIGECYLELSDKRALSYLNQSLHGFRSLSDQRNEHICLGSIGKYYYEKGNYEKAVDYFKTAFEYVYANLPHLSTEILSFYIQCTIKLNRKSELLRLSQIDSSTILDDANLQEKIFYYETLVLLYEKIGNSSLEFDSLRRLQSLYQERNNKNTFEELQKKLNVYELTTAVNKNKNLELKVSNLKLQNAIIAISLVLLVMFIVFIVDKQRKKDKIQKLIHLQLEQEKEFHEKNATQKGIQLSLEIELKKTKERELTALQLQIFEIKENVITLIESNALLLKKGELNDFLKNIASCFENKDYWKEFQLRFTNMHPDFISTVKQAYPKLTKKDIDFLILIKLNLSNKEIATLINISYESVISKRYLIRKKMNFDSDDELVLFLSKS